MNHLIKICVRAGLPAVVFLCALAGGCCDGVSLPLWRLEYSLRGAFSLHASFDASASFRVVAAVDTGAWAAIPAFDAAQLNLTLDADAVFETGTLSRDVDNDGKAEDIDVLVVTDVSRVAQVFYHWRGDAITLDGGKCYLAWVSGTQATLVAANCGDGAGTMVCTATEGSDADPLCTACDVDGVCGACDPDGSLNACVPKTESGGGSYIDIDIDVDIDIDADIDLDADIDIGFQVTP